VRGVRFNFVKRLVDSHPRRAERIAAKIATLGWHIVIYFEAAELANSPASSSVCRRRWW
jgi:2-pyrone-4,6-dicarboxylate lactonase